MPEIEVTPEHASDPLTRRIGIVVGIVGILLSVVTIASHRAHTQAVIHRTESNDLWSYYQAKKIRESTNDVALTLLGALAPGGTPAATTTLPPQSTPATAPATQTSPASAKFRAARDKYAAEAEQLSKDAHAKDAEQQVEERRALRFDIGEGLLELGLVLCSLYFLARRAFFPVLGILAAMAGTALGISGWML